MGPVRRGLILAAFPLPALAETCKEIRPYWLPGSEATAWSEMIALFSTVPSLALLLASALCLRFRRQWGTLAVVVLWTAWISVVSMLPPSETQKTAIAEGCIGSPTLFIAAVAAICVGMILYTAPRPKRTN